MASVPAEPGDALASTPILGHAGVLAVSSQGLRARRGSCGRTGAEQRPLGTVQSGRGSDEAGTAAGVDAFFPRFTFAGVRVPAL